MAVVTLEELARRLRGQVRGDGAREIRGVATLADAGPYDIAFLANPNFHRYLATTRAAAVILTENDVRHFAGNALIVDNPHLCFARVAGLLNPEPAWEPGTHPSAVVAHGAQVSATAWIGPHSVVAEGAIVADNVFIGPGCFVDRDATIGADSRLVAHVTICRGCVVGKRCIIHPGAVIGSDGFGYAHDGARWIKVPQLGRAVLGDDVDVGSNTTIDRGALGDTVIADGVKLDNLIQIAHNVQIGEHTAMAAFVGVAGSVVIGKRCTFGGRAGIAGHLEIADDVHVTGTSLVSGSITKPGVYSSAISSEEAGSWRKNAARLRQLDALVRRVKELEHKVQMLIEGEKLD
ncbi:MAG: UDP-3-O-(3-hydroxymyristoyl)glucosamine N-acyltransferase [Gammaproteobacteria bacterium]|nr:UDP-3-O-(3-hydroxymyristoyl)glucosamine N-acyltransferase [Gammaproteobacteria bacterium]